MSHGRLRRLLAGLITLGAALLLSGALIGVSPVAAAPPTGPLPPDVAVGDGTPPAPAGSSSASWLVADLTDGRILGARAGSARRAPASTQKILTALTFAADLPPEVEATTADTDVTGRTVGLVPGVRYPSGQLLDALFVTSGNDVALAMARAAGSADPTATGDRMTATARALGATDTTAANATGLDAGGQLTTPYDLAVLTRAALARPELRRAVSLAESDLVGSDKRTRHFPSSNPLLGSYPGAIGVKTGSTAAAGQTFVGAAERDGRAIAVVLMQAPTGFTREATQLLNWGFAAAASPTTGIATLPPVGTTATGPAGRAPAEPVAPPLAEDGGGVSPRLALALAVTIAAAAFTYWQGREKSRNERLPSAASARPVVPLPDVERVPAAEAPLVAGEDPDEPDQSWSSARSRRIFAP